MTVSVTHEPVFRLSGSRNICGDFSPRLCRQSLKMIVRLRDDNIKRLKGDAHGDDATANQELQEELLATKDLVRLANTR